MYETKVNTEGKWGLIASYFPTSMHALKYRNEVTKIKCKDSSTGISSYATLISLRPLKVRALVTTKNKRLLISEQLSH